MNVQFGARLAYGNVSYDSSRMSEEGAKQAYDDLIDNPVTRLVKQSTSDDIVVNLETDPATSRTEARMKIDRAASDLPEGLQKFTSPTKIFNFAASALTDPQHMDTLKQWLNKNILDADEALKAFDAKAAKETKAAVVDGSQGLAQVAGMDELKALFSKKVIGPLRNPEKYQKYRRDIPNGVLLYGAPGCGKTYFSDRLAEELGYPVVKLSPSSVADNTIHQTTKLIGEKFDEAEKLAKETGHAIVYIDEIDALLPSRANLGEHSQYKKEEVTELLQRLNKAGEKGIFVIGATNQPQQMDEAALRTGRLDEHIYVGPPDVKAREASLQHHMRDRYQDDDIDYGQLAAKTAGFSQSDLEYLVNTAVDFAIDEDAPIGTKHLLQALDLVPPSVTPETEKQYRTIETRGTKGSPAKSALPGGFGYASAQKLDKRG